MVAAPRVLITGCNGFIGRALAERCSHAGWNVRGSVRSAEGQARLPKGIEPVIVPDIGPQTDWSRALQAVDAVVHLAASVHGSGSDAKAFFRVNSAGTARLVRTAAQTGVKRFLFLSTVKVFGEGRPAPYRETDPEDPADPYAASKLEAERAIRALGIGSGLDTVIIRSPLVYGPEVKANFLRLLNLVEKRLPLPFAGIENRRSLIYIGNLISAIEKCLHAPAAEGKIYLVADPQAVSTPALIREIAAHMDIAPRLFYFPSRGLSALAFLLGLRPEAVRLMGSLLVDASKIHLDLGWVPPFPLTEGMRITVDWYRQQA